MKPKVTTSRTPTHSVRHDAADNLRRTHGAPTARSHKATTDHHACLMCGRSIAKPDDPHACFYYE